MVERAHIEERAAEAPRGAGLWAVLHIGAIALFLVIVAGRVLAASHDTAPDAFAAHCFSPLLTGETAAERLAPARVDFYDLRPFRTGAAVSEPGGRPVTPGTDRRCEVAFDGAHVEAGIDAVRAGLSREGILDEAPVPGDFAVQDGASFVAARFLNPNRIAVVQVGTRPGPNGTETFINVERLEPSEDQN
ncbi:succinyl-CoA synthetase subunit beta [Roseibacterium sp. SDUM158016]|uniref:succinyl-CoA synthetase subunit beta n=1 Tax=Roseicyclus sediminis TaxID=2980997 RepID=UPI0021CEB4F2|nr:succinyl-CoA synthetase subunit beta [Roseibacterium sp. SDUM158016]MCU4651225.1 succinyl-CoA synthetase subunit beta [Roseibacterium sp. SDUM158016]